MEETPRRPFQFGIATLLGLTAVVAVVVWLAVSELPFLVWMAISVVPQLPKALAGVLLFVVGLNCILVFVALIRVQRLRALSQAKRDFRA